MCGYFQKLRVCALCHYSAPALSAPHPSLAYEKYLLQSFASTRSLHRFADILRPAAPPSWIDFVILSLRYHVLPHGIYHIRRIISAKMTDMANNNTPYIIERPSRPCSLPSFQFRFWTSFIRHIPSVLYEKKSMCFPPGQTSPCSAEAHQRYRRANCHR